MSQKGGGLMGITSKITCLIYLLPLFLFPFVGNAGPKEDYELQERCGKRAEERFKTEVGNNISSDKDFAYSSGYTNHYNTKLNKCFILVTTTSYPKDRKGNMIGMKNLYDINENKEYASFVTVKEKITDCRVLDKDCKSEGEWDMLIKPYMEE